MRPRIRTIKPEMWEDEKIVALSRDARLLLLGLVTMADDEGRFRARRTTILGHVLPGDSDAPKKVDGWIREIQEQGIVVFYVADGTPYGAFRHWRRHQKINRPNPSELPPPPDPGVVRDNAVKDHGSLTDASVKETGDISDVSLSHAQARGPFPVVIPEELQPHLEKVTRVLEALAERKGAKAVNRDSVANVIAARPYKPLVRAAHDCAAWWDGQARSVRDVVAAYRNWLDRTDDLAATEPLGGPSNVVAMQRPSVRNADAWKAGYEGQGA